MVDSHDININNRSTKEIIAQKRTQGCDFKIIEPAETEYVDKL